MTIFEAVRGEVSSKQAAALYGLRIDHAGRGFCPWHDDGQHAALQFFPDGGCYCHSCHEYGDAIDLTAQMLKIRPKDAAWRLYRDFHLNMPVDSRPNPETKMKMQRERDERQKMAERYSRLCEVAREADERLAKYTPETADSEFDLLLDAKAKADTELNVLWENMKR